MKNGSTPKGGTLYFHSPCFDGIISAAIFADFLRSAEGWSPVRLQAVNYDKKARWLTLPGPEPFAVVDFLYHPRAAYWVDHHSTTFLSSNLRAHYSRRRNKRILYDRASGSCAELIWHHLLKAFGYRNHRFAEMVRWATRIDAAKYRSVDEVLLDSAPALSINRALALDPSPRFSELLVEACRTKSLAQVAAMRHVRTVARRAESLTHRGLELFQKKARLDENGIVVFDVDASDAFVSRYAPYHFFPKARYSAGILRARGEAKITAMRNPWRRFKSVPLGRIFAKVGGGGHQRVASVILRGKRGHHATDVLEQVVSEIRRSQR